MKIAVALLASISLISSHSLPAASVKPLTLLPWQEEHSNFDILEHKKVFTEWKNFYNRVYANIDEEINKYSTFVQNLKFICETNAQNLSFKLRLNQFGDMDSNEFRHAVHGPSGSCARVTSKDSTTSKISTLHEKKAKTVNDPDSIDWTNYNGYSYVTPVKNQGSCGSCWAFATTGSLECRYAINKGWLVSLSEQQLVDCSDGYGNYGCDGGWWYNAYSYIEATGGLCSEDEYPYLGYDSSCHGCGTLYDTMYNYADVPSDDEQSLEDAVAGGCVAVGIEADQSTFQFYSSGVLTGTCGTSIDQGVLAVGYGNMNGQDYWKVKNSWGTSWGDQGYVYICRDCGQNGAAGECGINMYPAYPNSF